MHRHGISSPSNNLAFRQRMLLLDQNYEKQAEAAQIYTI